MKKISLFLFLIGFSYLYSQSYLNLKTNEGYKHELLSNIQNSTFSSTEMIFKLIDGTIDTESLDDIINITFADEALGDQSLPVELLLFEAISGNNQVILNWSTASEINNDAFFIERSLDNEKFQKIVEIQGHGSVSYRNDYSFVDNSVVNGNIYYYKLADRDINGVITYHSVVNAAPNLQGNEMNQTDSFVKKFSLYANYPNPFNPETTIKFDIPTDEDALSNIKLSIYNSLGQLVDELYEGSITGGQYEIKWNASNLPSGIYYLSFQSKKFNKTQKLMLLK